MSSRYEKKKKTPEEAQAARDQTEIRRLKREVEELKLANTVLKQVASFFSKDRPPSDSRRSFNSPGIIETGASRKAKK